MTIFRAPLANSKGEVMLSMQATGVVPPGAVQFRGLWVTMNNLICATNDTGQARKYVGGFALEDPSGLLLVTETAPASVPMDGINANVAGAVVTKGGAGSLIHQGIGMTVSAPGGPIVVNQDEPALVFHAGLEYQSNSGSIEAAQERSSEAIYREQNRRFYVAAENWIRQEFSEGQPLGTLMEPAITNKCENYNANPDAALTNLTLVGTGSMMARVSRPDLIDRAGLSAVCTEGNVLELDNRSGTGVGRIRITGLAGNTNAHTLSAYCAKDPASTSWVGMKYTNESVDVRFTNTELERISLSQASLSTGNNQIDLLCDQGSRAWFILNQSEECPVLTSPIIVRGAAASRAVDKLSWPTSNAIGTQGMAAVIWRPSFSNSDIAKSVTLIKKLVSTNIQAEDLIRYEQGSDDTEKFRMQGSTAGLATVDLAPKTLTAGQTYLIASRWVGAGAWQIGFKHNGAWTWGTAETSFPGFSTYTEVRLSDPEVAGSYDPLYGSHYRNLYLWNEDKGTAWLENFFSGVAN